MLHVWLEDAKEVTITESRKVKKEFSKLSSIHFLHTKKNNIKFPYDDHTDFFVQEILSSK